jgi:NAD-dependent SIR2 family protein deacetylase
MARSWTPEDVEQRLPALAEELQSGDVTLFAGAGLSKNAGLPLWDELLSPLAAELGLDRNTDPVTVAQYYVNAHAQGRYLLNSHIVRQLRQTTTKFALAHALMKELPFRVILTTNFDELIERTLTLEPERRHRVVIDDEDLAYLSDRELAVVKVNGSVTQPNSLVLTREDFESYTERRPAITNYLKNLLATSTFLFVGTSLRDPAFASFNAEVLRKLGTHRRPFYSVVTNASKYEVDDYKNRGIELITLEASYDEIGDEVTKFLECLVHLVRATRDADTQDTPAAPRQVVQLEPRYQTLLVSRLGTGLSLQVNAEHVDRTHQYSLIERTDLLNYTAGDFVSIRRLAGANVSERLSSHVIYSESSERKLTFDQAGVVAFDYASKQPLLVEPLGARDEMLFTHAYRIFFPQPLSPGEQFDIVHRITLPGELEVLSPQNEIMSISLARIMHGVGTLRFRVCLSFLPRTVTIECLDEHGTRVACKGSAPTVDNYLPREWYERHLDISWPASPSMVSWGCDNPDSSLYIINYRA